jgi:DHA2 family multidrug resistance protein
MYGGTMQANSPAYQTVARNMSESFVHNSGSSPSDARKQSQYMMVSNVTKQAYIQGINDDFMVASVMTLLGGIPIIFLRVRKKKKV